jgi:hypothetical protein
MAVRVSFDFFQYPSLSHSLHNLRPSIQTKTKNICIFFFLNQNYYPAIIFLVPLLKEKKKKLNKRRFGQVNNAPLAGLRSGSIPPSLISLLWIIFWFFV